MRESIFRETVHAYHDIIESIEQVSYREEEHISLIRAKLRVFDGTMLWVREIYMHDTLETYSYYWLHSDESIIIGWDNAPHHRNIPTFPHHKHREGKIESSQERDLKDVLQVLKKFFERV